MYVYKYGGHAHIFLNIHICIYTNTYIYNTHINPVCEETLGPLVLEYIYMLRKTHQMSALSFYSDQILPLYIYVHMYMYIYACI